MSPKRIYNSFLSAVPPWIFIGAVVVLFPIFTYMTIENINRQKQEGVRLLSEKGAALIRSFEAGTRTGMMGMQWGRSQLQRLLNETAQQPDIAYLLVSDKDGRIIAHNDPEQIGARHPVAADMVADDDSRIVHWRIVKTADGKKIFEVFRRFFPTSGLNEPRGLHRHQRMFFERFRSQFESLENQMLPPLVIFVGLDMQTIEEARKADMQHTVIMAGILLMIGFGGIMLLFLAHSHRSTKASLVRIKAFSDNLVENMPIGLLATDPEVRIASFNQVAGDILQLSSSAARGAVAETVLPEPLWEILQSVRASGKGIEKEIEIRINNGKQIPLEINASALRDETERFLGLVLLLKDLTEVHALKREIARSQRLAAVGQLAAGVAHEIRNPLSSIKGFATYFKERYRKVPEDQEIADIMIQEVDRLNRVVGQLLEFARPVTLSKKPIQINPFIEASLKMVEQQAAAANVRITTRLLADDRKCLLDADKISQVLLNLYLNAIEAMSAGGELTVELFRPQADDLLEIRVTDSGAGIKLEDLAHVFDPYFTTKSSGTGLGLAIVHNIIEAHGGQISIKSRPDQGTTVTIRLPDRERDSA